MYKEKVVVIFICLFIGVCFLSSGVIGYINLKIKTVNYAHLEIVCVNDDYNETNIDQYEIINFCRIQDGINKITALGGGTVEVYNGTYFENLRINGKINLIASYKEDIGDDVGTIIDGNEKGNVINVLSSDVKISGFTIQNSGPVSYGINIGNSAISVQDCHIVGNYFGVQVIGGKTTNVVIKDCNILNNEYVGIAFIDETFSNTVRHCDFVGNSWGIWIMDSPNNKISYCHFSNNSVGIELQGPVATCNTIDNCRFENHTKYGLIFWSNSNGNVITNNDFLYNGPFFGTARHALFVYCIKQSWLNNYWKPVQFPNWRDASEYDPWVDVPYYIVGWRGSIGHKYPWYNTDPKAAHNPNTLDTL